MRPHRVFQLISATVIVSGLVAATLVCGRLIRQQRAEIEGASLAQARHVAARLSTGITANIDPLQGLGSWWLSQGKPLDREDWRTDGQIFLSRSSGLLHAAWVGLDGYQYWEAVPGMDPKVNRVRPVEAVRQLIARAKSRHAPAISSAFTTPESGPAVYVCFPAVKDNRVRGYVVGLYDVRTLISTNVGAGDLVPGLAVISGAQVLYSSPGPPPRPHAAQEEARAPLELPDQDWTVTLHVPLNYMEAFRTSILAVVAIIGALVYSFGMLLLLSEHRSSELQRANAALAEEVQRRVRKEAEVRDLEKQLRRAQRMKSLGVMAAGIAHDFNNILTTILGRASLAKDALPEADPARRNICSALEAAERASRITHQVLAYTGQLSPTLQPTDLGQVVRQIEPALCAVAGPKAKFDFRIGASLPEVMADRDEIRDGLKNLVMNAVEAIEGDNVRIEVAVEACELSGQEPDIMASGDAFDPGAYVRIGVRDTGAGMSAEIADRAFDPFFSTKFVGRGLGLSEVLGIMRAHSGAARLESAPNSGTLVELFFPARQRNSAAA